MQFQLHIPFFFRLTEETGSFLWAVSLAIALAWIWSIIYLANKKFDDSIRKVCWLLILLFLGPLGTLLYFCFGREADPEIIKKKEEREFERFFQVHPECKSADESKSKSSNGK
ncbi:MAG: PLDc N-terminal domain-containing protein [Opitutales bacterium]|nr:PLDc N-terminal domain-containing protein [Opitutales bacterium]MCH8540063.1 PLDc N-terminal domain-containing protein [Opitutales bacterium]